VRLSVCMVVRLILEEDMRRSVSTCREKRWTAMNGALDRGWDLCR
jgi:hypothetical protein